MKIKKNKILNIAIIAVLLLSILGIVAYAKYITTINASTSLQVAKWNFKVNNSENNLGTIDFGRKTYDAETLADGVLAPGTSGSFDIRIDATGTNTDVAYSVSFENIENKPENLFFTVGDVNPESAEANQKYYNFNDLASAISGTIKANDTDKARDITINWAWNYETTDNGKSLIENDTQDTTDGKNSNNFSFDISIKGIQLTPTLA